MKRLHSVNESLKKYSHVNKKALDQYVSFSEQRETLLQRKTELDAGQAAIQELVDALDMQKDEVCAVVDRQFVSCRVIVVVNFVPSLHDVLLHKSHATHPPTPICLL